MSYNLPSPPADSGSDDPFVLSRPASHSDGYFYPTSAHSTPGMRSPLPTLVRRPSVNSKSRYRSASLSSAFPGPSRNDALNEEYEDAEDGDQEGNDSDDTGHITASLKRRGKGIDDAGAGGEDGIAEADDDPITLKDRQSLINVQHPFGLPIWKPALYKKSRSVTRYADQALHSIPSAQAERHLLAGNIFWSLMFGWWLALICLVISLFLSLIPQGGKAYATLVYGLGWYLFWPFGKYVEGDLDIAGPAVVGKDKIPEESTNGNNTIRAVSPHSQEHVGSPSPVKGVPLEEQPTITPDSYLWKPLTQDSFTDEATSLLRSPDRPPFKYYGTHPRPESGADTQDTNANFLGKFCFWLSVSCIIAPLMLLVCLICWALIITIPMAKLNWVLLQHILLHPTAIRFCAAPPSIVMTSGVGIARDSASLREPSCIPIQPPFKGRLAPGQAAPSGSPKSTVLLCTYRAVGLQYYKYTVGGVNIFFVNLLPVVFFVIFDGMIILKLVERLNHEGKEVPRFLAAIASRGLIFVLSLLSVIPLSYFIGMAVASISAQSSIGMGAVINATFGSIIEILLYCAALTQGKGRLVEGSIVGSLLAGVLLMPGMSMCSSALRRKEQRFNAKSAGVTSMMLIMAIIGALAPTLFYQTYGNFQLVCTGCSDKDPFICQHCYYKHPNPATDPFYQSTVKNFMYLCAAILLFSYLIGLWFSLRTHASQIWQNPQPLLHHFDIPGHNRTSLYQKLVPFSHNPSHAPRQTEPSLRRKTSNIRSTVSTPAPRDPSRHEGHVATESSAVLDNAGQVSPNLRRVSYALSGHPPYSPLIGTIQHTVNDSSQIPQTITTDDFTRAVAVATASALQHHQVHNPAASKHRTNEESGTHGHDGPSWSRITSASVLLSCTALYAVIAEILVNVVDVMLEEFGVAEKFLGLTLFALVPNTTEFMNAISFALNGNIALSMEIGSAYALQVCLLQIPAMVAFSGWHNPKDIGEVAKSFTLIFPRWDAVSLVLSMFLMTYTYIEAKSNYHRGSILILSYTVLVAGFYFAPDTEVTADQVGSDLTLPALSWKSLKWYIPSIW